MTGARSRGGARRTRGTAAKPQTTRHAPIRRTPAGEKVARVEKATMNATCASRNAAIPARNVAPVPLGTRSVSPASDRTSAHRIARPYGAPSAPCATAAPTKPSAASGFRIHLPSCDPRRSAKRSPSADVTVSATNAPVRARGIRSCCRTIRPRGSPLLAIGYESGGAGRDDDAEAGERDREGHEAADERDRAGDQEEQ